MGKLTSLWTGIAITLVALLIAALHLARPSLSIDTLTLALLVVAALPWLGSIVTSLPTPWGAINFREVKQDVEQVKQQVSTISSRVADVEQMLFHGTVRTEQVHQLKLALTRFRDYLADIGISCGDKLPEVFVLGGHADTGTSYDVENHAILLGTSFASDPVYLLREFTHFALLQPLGPATNMVGDEIRQLESGLAFYFPCSSSGRPHFGELFDLTDDTGSIADTPPDDAGTGNVSAGRVWASVLWRLRGLLGSSSADRLAANAWSRAANKPVDTDWTKEFVGQLLPGVESEAGTGTRQTFSQVLTEHGIAV